MTQFRLDAFTLAQTPVVLAKSGKFTRFRFHGRVPHVRGIQWNQKVYPVITLQDCKLSGVVWIWRGDSSFSHEPLWFEGRVKWEFKSGCGEEFGNPL